MVSAPKSGSKSPKTPGTPKSSEISHKGHKLFIMLIQNKEQLSRK